MKKLTLTIATLFAAMTLITGCTNQEVTTGGAVVGGVAVLRLHTAVQSEQ